MNCGAWGQAVSYRVPGPLLEPLTDLAQVSKQWPTCPIPTSMSEWLWQSPWVTVYRTLLPIWVDWGGWGPAACWVPGSLIEGCWAGYGALVRGGHRELRTASSNWDWALLEVPRLGARWMLPDRITGLHRDPLLAIRTLEGESQAWDLSFQGLGNSLSFPRWLQEHS